jgi:hypothetical protein
MTVSFAAGLGLGFSMAHLLSWWTIKLYRSWYLMCRDELERLDPGNEALRLIGVRTSKRKSWEES